MFKLKIGKFNTIDTSRILPMAYIPGQTGGKDPKPKVKVDKSINFSSLEWRKEEFPFLEDLGGEADIEGIVKEKSREIIKYLRSQPEQLLKDQGVLDDVNDILEEFDKAFESDNYDDIEYRYKDVVEQLNEDDGPLNIKYVDVKFKKEKSARKKKAAAEDDDEDIDVIEGVKAKRKPQLKGPERIKHHFKVLLEERNQYKDRLVNAKTWIRKREEELRTRKTLTGLEISDKEMISIPIKIAEKRKQYDAIKAHWEEKRRGVYERAKAKYEKLMGVKIDDKKPKKEGLKLTKAEAEERQVEELIPAEDIRYRKMRPMKLDKLDVKEIGAIPEPPRAPKRKAPPIPQNDAQEYIVDLEEALGNCRDENKELKRKLQICEDDKKVKKELIDPVLISTDLLNIDNLMKLSLSQLINIAEQNNIKNISKMSHNKLASYISFIFKRRMFYGDKTKKYKKMYEDCIKKIKVELPKY